VRPLCAVLGAFAAVRTQPHRGEGQGTTPAAAALRQAARVRTAECALACLHLVLERRPVCELPQARWSPRLAAHPSAA
jgi:hypothetical protein